MARTQDSVERVAPGRASLDERPGSWPAHPAPVTRRAFAIGLILGLALCAVMPYNDYFVGATYLSGNYFPIGGVAALLLLTGLINPALIACGKRSSIFTSAEIITVWAMIVAVSGIPSSGVMRYLIPHIAAPAYYSTPANNWQPLIVSHLPKYLLVQDPAAVNGFFECLKRDQAIPWNAWAIPLAWWAVFVGLLYTVFFSISTIARRQWVENEHLTFPLVRLPIQLAEAPAPGERFAPILRDRMLWSAVALVTAIHTVKGLHLFYPSIPDILPVIHSADYFKAPPISSINDISIAVYPLIIGFAYLLSAEVCFSLWFFYLAFKVQTIIAAINAWDLSSLGSGIDMGPGFAAYQEAGGAVAVALWLVWSMRGHLKAAWRRAVGRGGIDDANEAVSYRAAFAGLFCGYGGLSLWLIEVAHVHPLMAAGVLAGSFVVFVVLAWLVAQAGLLFIQTSFAPSQITTALSPPATFDAQSLFMGCLAEHVGWYDSREIMLPSILNAQKAADPVHLSQRSLARALMATIFLAVIVSAAASIWLPYTHGGATSLSDTWGYVDAPKKPLDWTASILKTRAAPPGAAAGNMAAGAAFVLALIAARGSIAAFPFHPAGFLVAATYPMYAMWFSLFLAWLIKWPIIRYAGMRGYQKLLPFFLGLILGDCMNAIAWTVIGLATHQGYRLLPG